MRQLAKVHSQLKPNFFNTAKRTKMIYYFLCILKFKFISVECIFIYCCHFIVELQHSPKYAGTEEVEAN